MRNASLIGTTGSSAASPLDAVHDPPRAVQAAWEQAEAVQVEAVQVPASAAVMSDTKFGACTHASAGLMVEPATYTAVSGSG
jgi:hypothetical protein